MEITYVILTATSLFIQEVGSINLYILRQTTFITLIIEPTHRLLNTRFKHTFIEKHIGTLRKNTNMLRLKIFDRLSSTFRQEFLMYHFFYSLGPTRILWTLWLNCQMVNPPLLLLNMLYWTLWRIKRHLWQTGWQESIIVYCCRHTVFNAANIKSIAKVRWRAYKD